MPTRLRVSKVGWRLGKRGNTVFNRRPKYDIRGVLEGLCKLQEVHTTQSKEVHKEYMRLKRLEAKGSQTEVHNTKGSQVKGSQNEGSLPMVHSIATMSLAAKLVDPSWRELLEYLCENLKPEEANDVRVGCYGLTISEIKTLLPNIG